MPTQRLRRWSDHDKHLGRFITYAGRDGEPWWGVVLDSGRDERPGCHLRFYLGWCTLLIELPQVIQPHRTKVDCSKSWDAATIARLGRDWYFNEHEREFGVTLVDGHLSVMHGPQTHDSSTTKRWGYFLPWMQWRHVRHSFYGLAGEHFWTEPSRRQVPAREAWDKLQQMESACPTVVFAFMDYDGEHLEATTRIDEREWRLGEGWFKWLSLFRRAKVRRSLSIEFSGETGPEKGSWKGGTTGTGIEMLPGELHEAAFRRYCAQQHRAKYGDYAITFLGRVSPAA